VPKRSQVDNKFRKHVCGQIDSYISEHNITDVEAANVLGVRKQMIAPYRRGESLPGTEVIARACVTWNLSFNYKGIEISAKTFVTPNGKPKAVPHQLELPFERPLNFRGISKGVQDIRLTVTFSRVS
jgi:transcriptional regulator with XRE-family HTH domain